MQNFQDSFYKIQANNPSFSKILCLLLHVKLAKSNNFILVPVNKLDNLNCSPSLDLHKKSRFSWLFEAFLLSHHWSPNRLSPQLLRFNLFYFICSLHLSINVKSLSHLWIWITTIVKCRRYAIHLILNQYYCAHFCMFSKSSLINDPSVRESELSQRSQSRFRYNCALPYY